MTEPQDLPKPQADYIFRKELPPGSQPKAPKAFVPVPELVESAKRPFLALAWTGGLLLAVGAIAMFLSFGGDEGAITAAVISNACLMMCAPFLVGAAIIAGLGKREDPPTTD